MGAVAIAIAEDDPRLLFVPLEEATVPPPGLIEHLKAMWWAVHPTKGLVFYDKKTMSPQCNSNQAISNRLRAMYPWAEVRFIPSAFRRIDPQDHC